MGEDDILYSGPVDDAEDTEEMKELKRAAEKDEFAAEKLAKCYWTGDGTTKNPDEALRWFGRSRSSLARYGAATVYLEQKQYRKAEKELMAGLEAEDGDAFPEICVMLGKLCLTGHISEGQPDYVRAARYLEKGLGLNPLLGSLYAGLLGIAYEGIGRNIQAIHWYRRAAEEFGQEQYRENLYRLYLTGAAGAAKKRLAEEILSQEGEC